MNNRKLKLFMFVVSVFTAIILINLTNVKADTLTVDNYKSFLEQTDVDALSEYNSLSKAEQQEVVDKISDPKTYNDSNFRETDSLIVDRSADAIKTSIGTKSLSIGKFAIVQYRVSLTYSFSSGRVRRIYNSAAYVTRNLSPVLKTNSLGKSTWISNGNAYLIARFSYNVGPIKGLSIRVGTFTSNFAVNGRGQVIQNYWLRS